MADIRIRQLPNGSGPVASDFLPIDNGTTRRATIQDVVEVGRPAASQAEAEAATNPTKVMTPLTTSQAVSFYGLTKDGNLSGLTNVAAARGNLGLGNSSTLNVGTTVGTVAAGDDTRIVGAAQKAANLSDLANASTARTNLGLGGAAVLNVGTTAGTVAEGNDSRIVNAIQTSAIGVTVAPISNPVFQGTAKVDSGVPGVNGTISMLAGDATGTGFLAFYRQNGVRAGYIGYANDSFKGIGIRAENGYFYEMASRFNIFNPAPTNSDINDVSITRTAPSGGTPGFVNSALRVDTTVNSVTTAFEWALLAKLTVNAAGGGEHCGAYSQIVKNADGSAWAHCVEQRDNVPNPTTGSIGIEEGMFVKGGDASGMRHAIDISIGSTDSLPGTNIVTTGIRIGPTIGDSTLAQLVNGIQIKGKAGTGIDLSLLDVSYSTTTFRMPTNGIISWRDNNQTLRGEIGWNATINSWQLTGVLNATSATAGGATALPATPAGYMHFQLNGTMRKVPYYAV